MKLVNIHNKKNKVKVTVYIGRPSVFGNPFILNKDGDRKTVVRKYEEYVRNNYEILEAIKELKEDDVLGCYCSPLECHGDVILKIWKELNDKKEEIK